MTGRDPRRRSILARLNLESPSASEEISANRLRGDDVTRRTEPESEERSTAESDPNASQNGPEIEALPKEGRWDQARRRYIETNESLRALAAEFSISNSMLKRRAKKEGWRAKREAFRQKLDEQLEKVTLISRAEAHEIQTRAALETLEIFRCVFESRARELRADPSAKSAAENLARLIALQLDTFELSLSILGDVELDARAAQLSASRAAAQIH